MVKVKNCVAAIALLATPVLAEEAKPDLSVPPDLAGVTVPDLAFKPSKRDPNHYWEYFAFHKTGVTYQKAFADIVECEGYSRYLNPMRAPPEVVLLGGDSSQNRRDARPGYTTGLYQPGTLGSAVEALMVPIIFAIAADSVNYSGERANTRRCMAYKGYKRYGLNRAIWDKLRDGKELVFTARLALIASAPNPPAEEIDP